jgi:hypothetical protein
MRHKIRQILKENDGGLESRFISSTESIPYIIESMVDTNLITNIEIENIKFDQKYNEISAELVITSWNEDPDLFMLIEQLKRVDKELDKVLLKYSFREDGSFGKNRGKYNNLMFYLFESNWSADNNFTLTMKYVLRQEEYDED